MNLQYSSQATALYIEIKPIPLDTPVKSKELTRNIILDLLPSGELAGIDLLGIDNLSLEVK
jgi:uncharacterized protein YuzE